MAIISSNWIIKENDGNLYCLWPSYLKTDFQRKKAILEHQKLVQDKCGLSQIRIIYRSSDYKKANEKLKRFEEESSVSQTDYEETPDCNSEKNRKSRKSKSRSKSYILSSESDEDGCEIPQIPQPKKSLLTLSNLSNSFNIATPTPTRTSSPTLTSIRTLTSSTIECTTCKKNEALITHLIAKVEKLTADISYLIRISQQGNGESFQTGKEITAVSSKTEMENLNTILENPEEMASKVLSFQIIGGKDVCDTTRRILHCLMNHNLAVCYNWSGKNNKYQFSCLKNIIQLIVVAVRRNPLCKNSTQKEVEDVIKTWLRNAPDREGGRTQRKARSEKSHDNNN